MVNSKLLLGPFAFLATVLSVDGMKYHMGETITTGVALDLGSDAAGFLAEQAALNTNVATTDSVRDAIALNLAQSSKNAEPGMVLAQMGWGRWRTPRFRTPVIRTPVIRAPVIKAPVIKAPVIKAPVWDPPTPGSQCSAPTKGIGCFDAAAGFDAAIEALTTLGGGDAEISGIIKDVLRPAFSTGLQAASATKYSSVLNAGFCFGEFGGKEISDDKGTMNDHGCTSIPVKEDENYLIMSIGIPTDLLQVACPGAVDAGSVATICMAYATCNNLPTMAFMVGADFLSCAAGNPALTAGTVGLAQIVAQAVKYGLGSIGLGFSLGADLELSTSVWDGAEIVDAKVAGNYFDYIELEFDPLADTLGIPEGALKLTGSCTRMISIFGDATDTVHKLAKSKSPESAIGTIISNFAMVMELKVELTIGLSALTLGALPDTTPMKIGSFGMLASTQPKSQTNVPQGLYGLIRGVDIVKSIVSTFLTFVIDNLGGVLDAIFGEGAAAGFVKAMEPDGSSDTIFAISANTQLTGFFVQAPVAAIRFGPLAGDIAGMVSVACKIRNSDGHFSCEIDYKEPKWLSAFLDGAVFVAKEAQRFFDESGKIIAAVSKDALKVAGKWTKKAIQDTGKAIEDGAIRVSGELKTWAKEGGGKLFCGMQYAASATDCGTSFLADAAKCGKSYVVDAAKCGSSVVSDIAKCGFNLVQDLCSGCSGCSGCGWGGCSGCSGCSGCDFKKKAKSCSIARGCNVARKCNVALKCNIPRHC